ncbi:MAG TPA: hypothetical protein VGI18_13790 [Burkholderiales bacterium]|jgi:hypothetical protein
MTRVSVVTQRGKVLGVYIPPTQTVDPRAPIAYLIAGRGQVIVDVEVAVPAVLKREKDIKAFHAAVAKKLKGRRRK